MAEYKKTKEIKKIIKSTAKTMFSQFGYDNVKVEDIAFNSGVAKGLVFYHFSSKEGLLSSLIQDEAKIVFERLMEFVKEIVASVTTAGIGGFFAWFFRCKRSLEEFCRKTS